MKQYLEEGGFEAHPERYTPIDDLSVQTKNVVYIHTDTQTYIFTPSYPHKCVFSTWKKGDLRLILSAINP